MDLAALRRVSAVGVDAQFFEAVGLCEASQASHRSTNGSPGGSPSRNEASETGAPAERREPGLRNEPNGAVASSSKSQIRNPKGGEENSHCGGASRELPNEPKGVELGGKGDRVGSRNEPNDARLADSQSEDSGCVAPDGVDGVGGVAGRILDRQPAPATFAGHRRDPGHGSALGIATSAQAAGAESAERGARGGGEGTGRGKTEVIASDATAASAARRMHVGDRCAIEIALSFQSVFGYHRSLVGLSTEVDALARSGPDLVAFLAFPTDRPRFQFEWNSPRSLVVGKKLYVGNLSYGVSDSALEQLFSQFGTVQRRR